MSASEYKFSADLLLSDGRVDESVFRRLRRWIDEQDDVPPITDQQLCLFQMACENKFDETNACIRAYYRIKSAAPQLFDGRDVRRADLRQQLDVVEFCVLPERTDDDCAIIVHRLCDPRPANYHMEVAMKMLFMTLDAALYCGERGPPSGLVILFDMRHVGLAHLTRIRLGAIRLFFSYLQEALPVRLREIHVFNAVWFFDKIMSIIKPFMNGHLFRKLHLHPPGLDYAEFSKRWIPPGALPADFGGDLPSVADLHRNTTCLLTDLTTFFHQEEKQRKQIADKVPS